MACASPEKDAVPRTWPERRIAIAWPGAWRGSGDAASPSCFPGRSGKMLAKGFRFRRRLGVGGFSVHVNCAASALQV